jgi:hypothetical protein
MKLKFVVAYECKVACEIPKWYGVAYNRYATQEVVMALIPLNLLIRWARDVWIFCKHGGTWNRKQRMTLQEKVAVLECENKHLLGELQIERLNVRNWRENAAAEMEKIWVAAIEAANRRA